MSADADSEMVKGLQRKVEALKKDLGNSQELLQLCTANEAYQEGRADGYAHAIKMLAKGLAGRGGQA